MAQLEESVALLEGRCKQLDTEIESTRRASEAEAAASAALKQAVERERKAWQGGQDELASLRESVETLRQELEERSVEVRTPASMLRVAERPASLRPPAMLAGTALQTDDYKRAMVDLLEEKEKRIQELTVGPLGTTSAAWLPTLDLISRSAAARRCAG